MFIINDIIALLAANLILTQALGTSTMFIAASGRKNLIRTACVITLFTTVASAFTYFVDTLMPSSVRVYATLICYTLIIGVLYAFFLTVLYFFGREKFNAYKKYIHISAFNCAVMGTLFTISEKAAADDSLRNTVTYFLKGLEAGAGFIVASLFLAAAFKKLNSEKVPASFRGYPAMLIYLGIISMAVYALK
ncbi:MAG: hypothetical protein KBA55_05540 [Ruminococcus sp.]|nr:hypothetical protein [Ruminococcus sp.]